MQAVSWYPIEFVCVYIYIYICVCVCECAIVYTMRACRCLVYDGWFLDDVCRYLIWRKCTL
jgi:hypothetical protein